MTMPEFVHSFWQKSPIGATTAPLEGDVHADILIVGGGVVGLSCAYYLSGAGAKVILLEREAIGSQSSTRNYGELSAIWDFSSGGGLEERRRLARFSVSTIDSAEELIEREGIDCGFTRNKFWMMAQTAADMKAGQIEGKEFEDIGFDSGIVGPDEVPVTAQRTHGAVWIRQAVLDPYQFISGLKQAVLRRGVQIHEYSEVTELKGGKEAVAKTKSGKVTARKAILAVNALAGRFGFSQEFAFPAHVFSLATKPLPAELAKEVGPTDDEITIDLGERGERRFFQRFRPDGRLLFGGGPLTVPSDEQVATPVLTEHIVDVLRSEMVRRYPALAAAELECAWGGSICTTVGERPVIAPLPDDDALIIALICNGRAMGLGSSAGRLALSLVDDACQLDEDAAAFLEFCGGPRGIRDQFEGALFKFARTSGVRSAVNLFFSR